MTFDERDHENDLHYHALNYRTAATPDAEQAWQELQACVARLVAAEREACANIASEYEEGSGGSEAIRMRSNA